MVKLSIPLKIELVDFQKILKNFSYHEAVTIGSEQNVIDGQVKRLE
jgi:hypothetical protein